MYQLRNLVHRTNVHKDPEKNMDSAEDFMLLMLHTHVVATAKVILDLQPVETVQDLAKMIIVNFVRLPNVDINHGAGGSVAGSSSANADGVYVYCLCHRAVVTGISVAWIP